MSVDTDTNISPVLGTNANDILVGTGRSEVLSGAGGDDVIQALSGDDEVFGGTGNDILYGQGGNDTMYGNGKPAYVDMTDLVIAETVTATVTFVDEGAGFRNALGVYEIAANGSISNVQILFANASKVGSGGDLIPGQSAVAFDVNAGAQLGFFVVSNGFGQGTLNQNALTATDGHFEFRTPSGIPGFITDAAIELWYVSDSGAEVHIRSQYGYSIFHSAATAETGYAPNPDVFPHVVGRASTVTGELMIGFEDLWNGGDKDYDDTVITVSLGQPNVVALLPQPSGNSANLPDDDHIYGGDGDDHMFGIGGNDHLYGGNGNDDMSGNSGDDYLEGNDGHDVMNGNSGDDQLSGGNGNDNLSGASGDDVLSGDGGNDILSGGSGMDTLFGGSGNDTLSGDADDDVVMGGSGDDVLNGNSGNDTLDGESGNDTLDGQSGDDVLFGGSGQDELVGGSGNDLLDGGDHNDRLQGGSGSDQLFGGAGDDYLSGGTGNDTLNGGSGNDKLLGGAGSDLFRFDLSAGSIGADCIYDFDHSDLIEVVGSGYGNMAQLVAATSAIDGGMFVDFGAFGSVTLLGWSSELTADDFLLA